METNLSHFTDVHQKVQKLRVATGNRIAHLEKRGKKDDRSDEVHKMTENLEKTLERFIAEEYTSHPVYPWTSKIKGCGLEAAPKVVGIIEGTTFSGALLSDLAAAGIVETMKELKENWGELEEAHPEKFQRRTGIYAFDNPSKLRRYAGLAPVDGRAEKVSRGQKGLHYNPELRMMLWRLLTRLMQQVDYRCPDCRKTVKKESVSCKHCGAGIKDRIIEERGIWYEKYLADFDYYIKRFERDGVKVIPTPAGRFCPNCLVEKEVSKTTKICTDCGEKLMPKEEPPGVKFLGHVVNMAKRRTIRLWLDMLWVYWREALDLPTRSPWIEEYGKHTTIIRPMDMVDKPKSVQEAID